jgi:predicted GH43/DUF377 family glycosyl hydrolase
VLDDDMIHFGTFTLEADPSRMVIRPFLPEDPAEFAITGHPRVQRIADRVLAMSDEQVHYAIVRLIPVLSERHRGAEEILLRRFEELRDVINRATISRERSLLIGAYFSAEYAFESAALFNPSMILHKDQSGLATGTIRFIMALRGIGEGHISSVTFRVGTWGPNNDIIVDPPSPHGVPPRIDRSEAERDDGMIQLIFPESEDVSETVLFPVTTGQKGGIEDLRLVLFTEDDGSAHVFGTYTAFSGADMRQQMLHVGDFKTIEMYPLRGAATYDKGMALFPRRIEGRYAMIGRQDNENLFYLTSDDLHDWTEAQKIIEPRFPWDLVQMGNCGSPIEIDEGWLLLTHGVGVLRIYCIGACLLDKADPTKVLARTSRPLLRPDLEYRGGYVPNVVYSCGGLVHDRTLLLPYGVADHYTAFASVSLLNLLGAMD